MKYKTVTKIERISGKYPGQIKVVNKYPSKYLETGLEHYGEEGEAHFLSTGKKRKKFTPEHLDGMLIKRSDGTFEDPKDPGIFYRFISDSDTADYSSGHDAWVENENECPSAATKYKCNNVIDSKQSDDACNTEYYMNENLNPNSEKCRIPSHHMIIENKSLR